MPGLVQVLDRLQKLYPRWMDLSFGRMDRLLAALDHPHKTLPPALLIAGTNGKGSTASWLRFLLHEMGYRAHVYTSPHLVRFNERIRLANTDGSALVDDERLLDALSQCERVNDGQPITFFEITTIAAFLLFQRYPADFLVCEVGLGGRLDSTNVLTNIAASLFTAIDLDHKEALGNTLAKITFEKAGIMRPGTSALSVTQRPTVKKMLKQRARDTGAPLRLAGADWHARYENGTIEISTVNASFQIPAPQQLPGAHQAEYAALAYMTLREIGKPATPGQLTAASDKIDWPARLQHISLDHARLRHLHPQSDLLLDGGHNPAAAKMLAGYIASLKLTRNVEVWMIYASLQTKDARQFIAMLAPHISGMFVKDLQGSQAAIPPENLAKIANRCGVSCTQIQSLRDAFAQLPNDRPVLVLVTGTLYLAGELLDWLDMAPR